MDDAQIFIVGANGQLGTALRATYPHARSADIKELDITSRESVDAYDWTGIKTIINAAAYTNVDGAETPEGRVAAWQVNAEAVKNLVHVCRNNHIRLVHISTDYVFDGTQSPHTEEEPFSPLSVYGSSKAAGDILASQIDEHYILRTSWVIGEGQNFVRTMLGLAGKDISPTVVADQIGRLTFTTELVRAIDHLLSSDAPYGTYNVTNDGDSVSWADITREIYKLAEKPELTVTDTTTEAYFAGKSGVAPRPLQSTLDLTKLQATGFASSDWRDELKAYVQKEVSA